MRPAMVLPLLLTALLAGCAGVERHSNNSCINGACEDRSYECVGDDCEVCVEGSCADCDRSECEECYEDDDCPMLEGDAGKPEGAVSASIPDTDVRESYDLTSGLERITWTADIAAGATGHVLLRAHDLVTKEAVVSASVCYDWRASGPWGVRENNQGGCADGSNFIGNSGTTSDRPRVWIDTDELRPGRITLAVWADPSPNELVVEIVVDNP